MKIHVKVKPNSSKQEVENFWNGRYLVYAKSPLENDKANIEMLKLLSKELGVPSKSLNIKFGRSSDEKIIEIKF